MLFTQDCNKQYCMALGDAIHADLAKVLSTSYNHNMIETQRGPFSLHSSFGTGVLDCAVSFGGSEAICLRRNHCSD